MSCLLSAVTVILQEATHLINVGCGGFGWRLSLWCGPVHGLSPDGAGRSVGLHRSMNTTTVLNGSVRSFFLNSISGRFSFLADSCIITVFNCR